jgi:hypothetical protein
LLDYFAAPLVPMTITKEQWINLSVKWLLKVLDDLGANDFYRKIRKEKSYVDSEIWNKVVEIRCKLYKDKSRSKYYTEYGKLLVLRDLYSENYTDVGSTLRILSADNNLGCLTRLCVKAGMKKELLDYMRWYYDKVEAKIQAERESAKGNI